MNPPIVYELMKPSSHRTIMTTAIVSSIFFLSDQDEQICCRFLAAALYQSHSSSKLRSGELPGTELQGEAWIKGAWHSCVGIFPGLVDA
jgi:hypothetical protein